MENNVKNIKEILANDNYIIPRYQRNYAWGKAEISQLIKDIDEFFPNENNEKKSYYLGSLVCFKREKESFELIDGQQRHTTITLINLVLKNWEKEIDNIVSDPNLKFDSRKKMQNYIESLYKTETTNFLKQASELNISGIGSFKDAIEIIQEELRDKDVQIFAKNFYENVYLFRVEVPEDTDLNHYFEIMNNRGEQLEKHEIVKALLMGKISDTKEQEMFAEIWDACADMSNYVFLNFDKEIREKLFTQKSELIGKNFEDICINLIVPKSTECSKFQKEILEKIANEDDKKYILAYYKLDISKKYYKLIEEIKQEDLKTVYDKFKLIENNDQNMHSSLAGIIGNHNIPNDFPKEEKFIKDKYKSVIDFPNFLLQVLKIKNEKVSLDDKKLLEQFNDIKPEPKDFIFDLLKYRILFDEFAIKQDLADADESKQNWGIRKLNTDFETTIKTFESDEELTKLQVMLYYSDSTNTYNIWLQELLKIKDFEVGIYTEKVWNITNIKFIKDKLSYPEISIFNLYFIDFLLWKLYKEKVQGKTEIFEKGTIEFKIAQKKDLFNNFKFKQLSSKEHLLPQSKANGSELEVLNNLGNLCLISTSQNSSANDKHPLYKKEQFKNDNSSLKRLIMFETFENDKWETTQILQHEVEIGNLIKHFVL